MPIPGYAFPVSFPHSFYIIVYSMFPSQFRPPSSPLPSMSSQEFFLLITADLFQQHGKPISTYPLIQRLYNPCLHALIIVPDSPFTVFNWTSKLLSQKQQELFLQMYIVPIFPMCMSGLV